MTSIRIAALITLLTPMALLAQYGAGRSVDFTVRVENVSTDQTLKLSNAMTAPAPTAPVLWTITDEGNPLFTAGKKDRGVGLERLAEEGNPGVLADYISTNVKSVLTSGVAAIPVGDKDAGPITPGKAYEFTVSASPGQRLTIAMMFGQSNDLFYSNERPIALFTSGGKPVRGDMTPQVSLWDAGTEVNEEPGLGANQAPRQKAEDAGTAERNAIAHVRDRWSYPKTGAVLRLAITPKADALSAK